MTSHFLKQLSDFYAPLFRHMRHIMLHMMYMPDYMQQLSLLGENVDGTTKKSVGTSTGNHTMIHDWFSHSSIFSG